jgi:hypothetical protein
MNVFQSCSQINEHLSSGKDVDARNCLIQLLNYHKQNELPYSPLINTLIRETGLYPYLQPETSSWQERFIQKAFMVDTGDETPKTLHREQSYVLKTLLEGRSVAVSAPTSFGKSFIIDAFITIKKPNNVLIIVPTIALMDETRRRLFQKFSHRYNIITTTDSQLSTHNLFVFPQERAVGFIDRLESLDLLVVDEFYKASCDFDNARSPLLQKAILKLSKIARQRYYLAPNISNLTDNPFTNDMEFIKKLDFSTVYMEEHHLYRTIQKRPELKQKALLEIVAKGTKTLIYAASYSEIEKVVCILNDGMPSLDRPLLKHFSHWLQENYCKDWPLVKSVIKGVGIHNGQLHRSLSQLQVKMFEDINGLDTIVSTSSLIEGVNTSAESVVLWKNSKGGRGNPCLDSFTYKNIIGRGGRMFRYFVGQIYLLEAPPSDTPTQLEIELPDDVLSGMDEHDQIENLTREQIAKIILYREKMTKLIGETAYKLLFGGNGVLQLVDSALIENIATDMISKPSDWKCLCHLNSDDSSKWSSPLLKVIKLVPGSWDTYHSTFVTFVQILRHNWAFDLPTLLARLRPNKIGIDLFFKLERNVSFKLATLLHDVNELQKAIISNGIDISPFVSKLSHAFLPSVVYQLEEYGLPRMTSRKLHRSGIIDFECESTCVNSMITTINRLGRDVIMNVSTLSEFDKYALDNFLDGIATRHNVRERTT